MNKRQKLVLGIAGGLIILAFLFPADNHDYNKERGFMGRGFRFLMPMHEAENRGDKVRVWRGSPDAGEMALEWTVIAVAGVIAWLIVR